MARIPKKIRKLDGKLFLQDGEIWVHVKHPSNVKPKVKRTSAGKRLLPSDFIAPISLLKHLGYSELEYPNKNTTKENIANMVMPMAFHIGTEKMFLIGYKRLGNQKAVQ